VSDGGPAAEAGLRAEDEITAVNGNPATGISGTQLGELLGDAPGTRVRLTCLRGGREFQAEIVLRDLLTH
jgi:putative serine protease PepD